MQLECLSLQRVAGAMGSGSGSGDHPPTGHRCGLPKNQAVKKQARNAAGAAPGAGAAAGAGGGGGVGGVGAALGRGAGSCREGVRVNAAFWAR